MPQMLRDQAFRRMVPVVGLEPTRSRPRRILNPLRLPFHHTGTFYRETPKILIGENKERTHYKSYILLYLGSLEKSRFLSEFILPDLLAFESTTSTNSITPAKLRIVYTNLLRLARGRAGLFYLLLPPAHDIMSGEISAAGIPGNWSRGNGVRCPASGSL